MFEDGQEVEVYNHYFRAKHKSIDSALQTHGLTKAVLKEKQATKFTKTKAKELVQFLNKREHLPIVAFFVQHDRDRVLTPAFLKIGRLDIGLNKERWRCAQEMLERTGNWALWTLDDALEHELPARADLGAQFDDASAATGGHANGGG